MDEKMPGILQTVNAFFSKSDTERAQQLYLLGVNQARNPVFYRDLSVPDTLEGRFDLISLHVALIIEVLVKQGQGKTSQHLFDFFFDDMDRSLREMGVGDMKVGKEVKKLAQNFLGIIKAYGDAFDDQVQLEQALTRNLYCDCTINEDTLNTLIHYIQRTRQVFAKLDMSRDDLPWPVIDLDPKETAYVA